MKRVNVPFIVFAVIAFSTMALVERVSFSALDSVTGFSPAAGLATAVVAARWSDRHRGVLVFGVLSGLLAMASGVAVVHSLAFAAGLSVEVYVAARLMRHRGDPVDRPETSAWWAWWGGATTVGVFAGALVFLLIDRPASEPLELGLAWMIGHGAGLVLVSPGIWAGLRWAATGGWRHRADLAHVAQALLAIVGSMVVATLVALAVERPEPLALPFLVLGWLAHSFGHRVTVMASSLVATATLLAVPWWIDVPAGTTAPGVTFAVLFGHAAASALAIEASARWHARALLSGVVEIVSEAVVIVDGGGRVMTGNPSARSLFGRGLEGASLTDLVRGLPPRWTTEWPTGLMLTGRGSTGREVSVEVSVGPVDAPGRPMLAVVCRDMTEIRAATEALRRSAEIIDASPDLVGWTDRFGNLLFLNRAGREMIGAGPDEAIDAWSAAGLLTREAIEVAERDGVWRGETHVAARSGARLPVLQTVVAHRSDAGRIRFYSILARDISERYALEQMKSEFVSNITHELRSPLTGVIGYLDLLLDGAFGDLSESAAGALREVDGAANLLLDLINDLLALWRAEDRGPGEPEELDPGDVMAAALRTMEPLAAGKRIAVRFETGAVIVVGDRRQLERAFLNLVSNAVKFTPDGGHIEVTVSEQEGYATVDVSDSGVGIPKEELGSIFDRFYRASTAERADIPGTGLGLPLVKQVVEAHGGEIRVRSVVGEGSTFSLRLPALVRTAVAV